jgi:hypothetical protein
VNVTVKTKLTSRIPEATKNLREQVDEIVGEETQNAASIAFQLTPRSNNNEAGHVHTQDTIHVYRNTRGNYELRAGGAMRFLELGTSTTSALAPMRTAMNAVRPNLINRLGRIKVL